MAHASNKVTSFPLKQSARTVHGDGSSASKTGDPTNEILSLVEQLQDSSRDAKERLQMAEDERDQLSVQLDAIRKEAEAAEAIAKTAEDLRRERDRLQSQTSKHTELISELKRKADEANQSKDDARRKAEELVRQAALQQQAAKKEADALKTSAAATVARVAGLEKEVAELRKQAADSSKSGGDAQKQILSLRQARDAASTQVADLKVKLQAMDDQLAEAGYERESLEKKVAQAAAELAPLRERIEASDRQIALLTAKAAEADQAQEKITAQIAESVSQRDEAVAALEKLKSGHEADLQQLRAERDALTAKISDLEEAVAKTAADEAMHAQASAVLTAEREKLAARLADSENAAGALRSENEGLAKQVAELQTVETGLNAEVTELRDKAQKTSEELAVALAAMEKATAEHGSEREALKTLNDDAVRERDQARGRAQSLDADVERMNREVSSVSEALDAAREALAERDARVKVLIAAAEKSQAAEEAARSEFADATRRAESLVKERDAVALSLDEARNSLIGVQKQIEFVISDRDAIRENAKSEISAAGAQLKDVSEENARLKLQLESMAPQLAEYSTIVSRFEKQRLDTIELSAKLENAQRDIKEMGASLAEARLMAKNAERRAGQAGRAALASAASPESFAVKALSAFPHLEAALETRTTNPLIEAMRKTFQSFTRRPGDIGLLNELCGHAQMFGEESHREGAEVLARVSSSFAMLLNELHLVPEQVTPAMLRTVSQTIEFLQTLVNQRNLDRTAKLDSVRIYAVDDDHGVCESIVGALQAVGLPTKTTQMPGEAVGELAGNRYDLVILDVHLPELDGFELCTHIRNMALHTETPIIFITGNASMENRVQSSLRGGNEFLSKPFNFQELGLKALTLILRSRLRLN